MKVTLKDIASESGYSISTVSRVLNGSGTISTDVQKKILKIAENLKYPFAKSKIPIYSNGTLHIALVTNFMDNIFFASFFHGLIRAARESSVQLSLIDVSDHSDNLISTINELDNQLIDGVCLFLPEMTQTDYKELLNGLNIEIPIISNALIQSPVFPTITFDGYSGGHIAAEYLMNKGYNSFGVIKGPFIKAEARFRYNGFKDHLELSGKELIWEAEGNFTFKSGADAFNSYYELDKKPEAIFACNDTMCKGFMEAAKLKNVSIPDDVAIISYDNSPVCEETFPAITTIDTDFKMLGMESIKTLKNIIAKQHTNRSTMNLIPVKLVERESA